MSSPGSDKFVLRHHLRGLNQEDNRLVTKRASFDKNSFSENEVEEAFNKEKFDAVLSKKLFDGYREMEKHNFEKMCQYTDGLYGIQFKSPKTLSPLVRTRSELHFSASREKLEDSFTHLSFSNIAELGNEPQIQSPKKLSFAKFHLFRKFLRSIHSKVPRIHKAVKVKNRNNILYIKNVDRNNLADQSHVINSINNEIVSNSNDRVSVPVLNRSLIEFEGYKFNKIYKVFKVLTTDGAPLLAVITSDTLYFIQHSDQDNTFSIIHSSEFEDLSAAVVGPFAHLVVILQASSNKFIFNTGHCATVASALITYLEVALRRWCTTEKRDFRFSVAEISNFEKMSVFYDVFPEDTFLEDEVFLAQFSVWLQEDYVETKESPLGPHREGYLMAEIDSNKSWAPVYVCLKNRVFYIFEDTTNRLPKLALSLKSDSYKGCRIHNNSKRPHTFELIFDENSPFNFGAANNNEMIEWIRDVHSAAVETPDSEMNMNDESQAVNCFISVSLHQILVYQFPNKIISRVLSCDVVNFKKSNWPGSYCCSLELSCREATEMVGDWMLYFVSEESYEQFCSCITKITQIEHVDEEDDRFLARQSDNTSVRLQALWNPFFASSAC